MAQLLVPSPTLKRRTLLAGALGLAGAPWVHAIAAAPELDRTAQQWRVMSRLGYGPTAALVQDLQAATAPRAWALKQLELA
ncbi:hypothetical protein [Rhodoferax aquaticus]|uniref:Lytic murein transglycosylase n=1 Tax=Rhodoferax aquaticus TaxID=2527691 RepID=A0A515ESX8_9BURK|nr:hypothetical protein [Rhodoferax aquaticus]QDL55738.1 hypothetical protein EXZ61_17040 [Rhodoferax aquaticus]